MTFPWERLTGEPLIYASMGTLVNGLTDVFRIILKAATAIPGRQLVLSIGSNIQMDDIGPIPASAIVVSKAPQIELLKRAELCITHAGINTTLESLALGVPMVAIPVGFDQPGIAARIVYHGVGKSVPVASMNTEDLSGAIQEVLGNPSYRDTARRFQRTIAQTHGLDRGGRCARTSISISRRVGVWQSGRQATRAPEGATIEQTSREGCCYEARSM